MRCRPYLKFIKFITCECLAAGSDVELLFSYIDVKLTKKKKKTLTSMLLVICVFFCLNLFDSIRICCFMN